MVLIAENLHTIARASFHLSRIVVPVKLAIFGELRLFIAHHPFLSVAGPPRRPEDGSGATPARSSDGTRARDIIL